MAESPVIRVELERTSGGVLQHLAIGALFGIGLFVAATGIYGLTERTNGSEWVMVGGLALLCVAELLRRANLNRLLPGAIQLAESKLTILHPPLLRAPLALDLRNVRVAALARTAADAEPSFPVYGYSDGPRKDGVVDEVPADSEWLPVRSLGPDEGVPNALLLFEAPLPPPDVRRVSPHGPRAAEPLGGIALCLADPAQARGLFDAAGLRPRIHEEDLERVARINAGEVRVE